MSSKRNTRPSKPEETFGSDYFSTTYDDKYDKRNPSYKFRSYLREIKRSGKRSGRMLDVGCAYGSFVKIAKRDFEVDGCDISQHAVEIGSQRVPDARIFQSNLLDFVAEQKYDIVTCFDILEHVRDLGQALTHLKLLLNDSGTLVITVPVYDGVTGKLVNKLDRDQTHLHKESRQWWINLLDRKNYSITAYKGVWRYYVNGFFYLHWISRLTRKWSPAVMIICKKKS